MYDEYDNNYIFVGLISRNYNIFHINNHDKHNYVNNNGLYYAHDNVMVHEKCN